MAVRNSTIGITGASGFIGTSLVRYFSDQNMPYVCFDGDLLHEEDIRAFFAKRRIEIVVHLVGTFSLPFEKQLELNLITTQRLLEVGIDMGLKKIIFTSSGAVYGEPIGQESFEEDELHPNTLYGLSKLFAEQCIMYYSLTKKLQYVILRLTNVYGPGSTKGVIRNFIQGIKEKNEITVAGDGSQSRNFVHVSDVCRAIEKAVYHRHSGILNISNPVRVSINDLVALLKEKYTFSIKSTDADNNLKDMLLNIDKAKKQLGFTPEITSITI